MLQIEHICKTYQTGDLVQTALSDVSLCLRESEFVAILGPSGSGKTTLLNVIGGLDRYDSGDLIINGVSTRQYRDRDWDAYRNHSIGFVFQSYNLIPHQTILSNVELALTISGQSRGERRRKAKEALEQVGLGDQLHKRPNQLSGGQMQRVAIARALVNDPDILLADEPTGALDSDTSVQVLDLLREVAKDRLVVMVTHNAELAEAYATRIVRLRDGKITDDSDPYEPEARTEGEHRRLGKASMSFLTAISLSFNNLRTKLGRTLLTSFAGSIGIIGIALILSMSNGVQHYIRSVEEDTLKDYPLEITDSTLTLATLLDQETLTGKEAEAEVPEWQTITSLLSSVSTNDLTGLYSFLESGESGIYDYVQSIEYGYSLSPHIYKEVNGKIHQVNPDRSFAAMGFDSSMTMGGMFSTLSNTDSFRPMPEDESLYLGSYTLKAGRWPEAYNELAVVLSPSGRVADITLYAMGLKDPVELDAMVQAFAAGEPFEIDETPGEYKFSDFLGLEFKLLYSADTYVYDESFGVWADRSGDEAFLRSLLQDAETLTIVGVVQPNDNKLTGSLKTGLCYPAALTAHMMEHAAGTRIVQEQLASPNRNVFTGKPFGEDADPRELSMDSLFTVDEDAIASLFEFDSEDLSLDFTGMDLSNLDLTGMEIDTSSLALSMPSVSSQDISSLLSGVKIEISQEELGTLFSTILQGYLTSAAANPATDFSALPQSFLQYLQSDAAKALIRDSFANMLAQAGSAVISADELAGIVGAVAAGYPAYLEAAGIPEEEATLGTFQAYLQSDTAQAILRQASDRLQQSLTAFLPTQEQLSSLAGALFSGYQAYAVQNNLPNTDALLSSFSDYLSSSVVQSMITEAVASSIDTSALEARAASMFADLAATLQTQLKTAISKAMTQLSAQISAAIKRNMEGLAAQLEDNLRSAFTLEPEALAEAFSMNMGIQELRDLVTALLSGTESSYSGNLRALGYADVGTPAMIHLYPKDFDSKVQIKQILEGYNQRQIDAGNEDAVIVYTDMVETLTSSVSQIIDAISIVLIAFVAISLIVSSIMIGIITYISVLERTKEIGILRAIGASKRNISQVFNAETFLVGLCAGAMGVAITLLILLPVNLVLHKLTGMDNIQAILPAAGAAILVALSMLLTITAGLIPSRKAARKDPVAALRSE